MPIRRETLVWLEGCGAYGAEVLQHLVETAPGSRYCPRCDGADAAQTCVCGYVERAMIEASRKRGVVQLVQHRAKPIPTCSVRVVLCAPGCRGCGGPVDGWGVRCGSPADRATRETPPPSA